MEKVEDLLIDIILEPYIKAFATTVFFGVFGYAYCSSYIGFHHINHLQLRDWEPEREIDNVALSE